MMATVEVERFSLVSSRPLDKILAAMKAANRPSGTQESRRKHHINAVQFFAVLIRCRDDGAKLNARFIFTGNSFCLEHNKPGQRDTPLLRRCGPYLRTRVNYGEVGEKEPGEKKPRRMRSLGWVRSSVRRVWRSSYACI